MMQSSMERIGIIVPDDIGDIGLYQDMLAMISKLGLTHCVEIHHAALETAIPIAKRMEKKGVHAIVSRGATLELIKQSGISIPLVNIPFHISDLCAIISQAKQHSGLDFPRIGIVTYQDINLDIAAFADLIHLDVRVYKSEASSDSIRRVVKLAQSDGVDVLVGGVTTRKNIHSERPLFLQYVSGESSLEQALREGHTIALARSLERLQANHFKTTVGAIKEGIISLDSENHITILNTAAKKLLGLTEQDEPRTLKSLWPQIYELVSARQTVSDKLVHYHNQQFIVNVIKHQEADLLHGVVITFQKVERIKQVAELQIQKRPTSKGHTADKSFDSIIGNSPALQKAIQLCEAAAKTSSPILLFGETGTGKEIFAQAIHNASLRQHCPFVAVNCAAIPPSLLESELFGYEEGAFTGAMKKGKPGFFEMADTGTIFLDEISALDHYGQTRLLRVLQEKGVSRLGSSHYTPLDFRVIAASNRDLWGMVKKGEFREDLFYRLNVFPVLIAPLRERREDIPVLVEYFSEFYEKNIRIFSPDAIDALAGGVWYGNIRELQHCVQRLCFFHKSGLIRAKHVHAAMEYIRLPDWMDTTGGPAAIGKEVIEKSVSKEVADSDEYACCPASSDCERNRIIETLRSTHGNQQKTSEILGIHKTTLYRKMQRYGIKKVVL